MKGKLSGFLLVSTIFLTLSTRILAHHGSAGYDQEKVTILKGTVTDFEWSNPHGQIYFDVTDDKGAVVHWISECGPPLRLMDVGWTRRTLKPGDVVIFYLKVARNGVPRAILQKMTLADGTVLENRP